MQKVRQINGIMLYHLAGLITSFLLSVSAAIPAQAQDSNYRDVMSGNLIDDATNTTIVENSPWPENLPYYYRSTYVYPNMKVRLVLVSYGNNLPSNLDWEAYLYDAYTKLEADIKTSFGDDRDVDQVVEAMGGNQRVYWEYTPGAIAIKGKIVMDMIAMMHDLYDDRSIRETTFNIQINGKNAAKIALHGGRAPSITAVAANVTTS